MITQGFWKNRKNLNIEYSIPAVISSFEDTGRVRALTKDLKNDEIQHIFWESDLAKWLEGVFISLQNNPNSELNKYAEDLIDKIISNSGKPNLII